MPRIVDSSLLRFSSKVRSATILGLCGAGGMGFLIISMDTYSAKLPL